MKLLNNYFLVKRPLNSVISKSRIYHIQHDDPKSETERRELLMKTVGFEDGYLQCLRDLGINHTIKGKQKL